MLYRALTNGPKDPIDILSELENSTSVRMNDSNLDINADYQEGSEQESNAPADATHEGTNDYMEGHPFAHVPMNVTLAYLNPMKHKAVHGIKTCDIHLRSYDLYNLTFYADFVLRTAWYLNLAASGPVPLPRRYERWTLLKDPFIHKKAQENFERVTFKRLITIKDGHRDVIAILVSYLNQNGFPGVGVKVTTWEWETLDFDKRLPKRERQFLDKCAINELSPQDIASQLLNSDDFQNLENNDAAKAEKGTDETESLD